MDPSLAAQPGIAQLISVFSAGVGTSLTPCVYPLIPITLAIFGAASEKSRARAFFLSCTYVCGIAATYTALGIVSAKTGAVFGAVLGHPAVVAVVTALLLVLTLYSLDIIEFKSIAKLQSVASLVGGKGYRGAFLMGTMSGLVAAPCAGPWLIVVLGIAASSQSTAWGALLLFTYALGMGLLFIALGTFPALLRRIPRSGNWLLAVKFVMAAGILAAAVWILRPLAGAALDAPIRAIPPAAAAVGMAAALALGRFAYKRESRGLKFLAAALLAIGFHGALLSSEQPPGSAAGSRQWLSSFDSAVDEARRAERIAMIDFFAEWCAACKELDSVTFSDQGVKTALQSFVTARIDFTADTPETASLTERFSIFGLPCILFLDAAGQEIPDSRLTGFVPPAEFLAHLKKVAASSLQRNPSTPPHPNQ